MASGTFLTAEWRTLLMLNYEVDRACLDPLVPHGTVLETFEGRVFVSVVGFMFLRTRVRGIAVPFHRDFEEVNLRFYVRRPHPDGDRRGVVFVKEIVPRRAIAWVARTVYNEHYVRMPMRHRIENRDDGVESVRYEWRHQRRWHSMTAGQLGPPQPAAAGSEEEFISEHYWGYAAQPDGTTVEYRVEHPRWRVQRVHDPQLECDAAQLYGATFASVLSGEPSSAFVADGSDVAVHRGQLLSATALGSVA